MDHASIIFRIVDGLKNWDYKSKNQWTTEKARFWFIMWMVSTEVEVDIEAGVAGLHLGGGGVGQGG